MTASKGKREVWLDASSETWLVGCRTCTYLELFLVRDDAVAAKRAHAQRHLAERHAEAVAARNTPEWRAKRAAQGRASRARRKQAKAANA